MVAVELRDIVKRFGEVTAVDNVSLKIRDGEFFSLLGPSGCGKTTTLRLIAGFEMPTAGEILIYGEVQGYRPPHRRPVNTVFQHYALFPHLTVYQNVAFGLEMQKVPKNEIRQRVGRALELVHLRGLENRRPKQLSGGQQQRVALARALINRPKVLLLDEPLGALDLKLRKAMQLELKTLQHEVGITFIYVTHDQEEAITMSDRIAVMNEGEVLQLGTSEEIYERPANRFVADFIGETNLIPGRVGSLGERPQLHLPGGAGLPAGWAQPGLRRGDAAVLSIRPEKIRLFAPAAAPARSPASGAVEISGRVEQAIYLGTDIRYVVRIQGDSSIVARVQNTGQADTLFQPGDEAVLCWKLEHARILKE